MPDHGLGHIQSHTAPQQTHRVLEVVIPQEEGRPGKPLGADLAHVHEDGHKRGAAYLAAPGLLSVPVQGAGQAHAGTGPVHGVLGTVAPHRPRHQDGRLARVAGCRVQQRLQGAGGRDGVIVHQPHPACVRVDGQGPGDPGSKASGTPGVLRQAHHLRAHPVLTGDLGGAVGGGVVNDDDPSGGHHLLSQSVQALGKQLGTVVGHHDGDDPAHWPASTTPPVTETAATSSPRPRAERLVLSTPTGSLPFLIRTRHLRAVP